MMQKQWRSLLIIALFMISTSGWATRQVTDQLGRRVTIPDQVTRVVVLQHQTLNLLVQLDAQDTLVGVLSSWKKQLGEGYLRLAPRLATLPMPGDLTQVNIESLLKLAPQVVFVANYAPPEMLSQIEHAGIPVIAVSLRQDKASEADKMNPAMDDENVAYNEGLKAGIRLIGNVVNRQSQADALIAYTFKQRRIVAARLNDIPLNKRVRVYIANPDLTTYGSGKYTGLMMSHAGAINVAAASVKGFRQVSIESVLQWNPQVILVQNRYPDVVGQIMHDPAWQSIDAVKHHRVYLMPEYAKAWGYPMPEALAIGELWLAKQLYPARFKDINMQRAANDYYRRFYRTDYQPAVLATVK
nr:ABC transporter substrate-binding protein [Brenneria ulupoensis]